MLELVDMPGMSAQFRICRMRTTNSKKVGGTLNGPFCVPKLRVPKNWFDDVFCMRDGPFREKCDLMTTMLVPFLRGRHLIKHPVIIALVQ